jgi:DNA-binding NarL/FixJ family response regulator
VSAVPPLLRIAVLDDHPAIRAGVSAMLDGEPDLVVVGTAGSEHELWPLLRRTQPGLVVLDVDHPGRDGLSLCLALKQLPNAPRVVLHSSAPAEEVLVAARVAGADAVLAKSASRRELLDALRAAGEGAPGPRALSPARLRAAAARIDPRDHAILVMRLDATPAAAIAETLGLAPAELARRIARIVTALAPRTVHLPVAA